MKYDRIETMRQDYPVTLLCRVFEVRASGYYAWRKRPTSPRAKENARLEVEIAAAHERTRQTYGPERLQQDLLDHGVQVGVHRIKRIRKKLNLRCKQKRKFRNTTDSKHNLPIAPNLLERNFQMSAPNQAWVSDLTYIWTDEGWLYLAGIKDLFNGELVGYAMSERMTRTLVMQALFGAAAPQAAGTRTDSSFGPRQSVLLAGLSGSCEAVRHENVHEPQGRLLGQRPDGKLLGFPEK